METKYIVGIVFALIFAVGAVFVWRRSKKGGSTAWGGVRDADTRGPRSGGNPVP